jgi:hypothetical protein
MINDNDFIAMFPAGVFAYSPGSTNGVVVEYFDGTTTWSSELGTANQTGSSFKIEAVQQETGVPSFTLKLYITFNCNLYDGSGASKTVTNGALVCTVSY